MDFELCTDNYDSVLYASKNNFKRVELCTALELGGLSPSFGLIQKCCEIPNIECHIIIRPRTGNFYYNKVEIEQMCIDIEKSIELGASGIVIGLLNPKNEIDREGNSLIMEIAKKSNTEITFHRAFDFTPNYQESLDQLINLGFKRVLSSGQKAKAIEGKDKLMEMVNYAKGRIEIMAGSGINSSHAKEISQTGVSALHFTARKEKSNFDPLNMGLEYEIDKDKIQGILNAI